MPKAVLTPTPPLEHQVHSSAAQPEKLTWDAAANRHLMLTIWFGVPVFIEPSARRRPAADGGATP